MLQVLFCGRTPKDVKDVLQRLVRRLALHKLSGKDDDVALSTCCRTEEVADDDSGLEGIASLRAVWMAMRLALWV